ncbi:MAG: glycogen debranching enzyme GlgX [Deltaproteobacteria bacterium CG_4_8_14_3_um_filter_45_9]|nr:MAG: glycogen debranching enzyme GlgX [Deltaproteobacteria bacterium CG03_land_8_20_14_0_80_45_14]PIX23722.1 MAG: glycogen debranching enzyme GlgX [Deltaproteobacteria bacterium CG_4_8_14_3_um_filter_45_9]
MAYKLEPKTNRQTSTGRYHPLGSTLYEDGVNFAIFSQYASEAFLLLFDRPDVGPTDIIKLEDRTKYIWHVFVHGLKAGQLYGYKIKGDFNPVYGMRFNENKFLIDPYAKAVTGKFKNIDNLLLAYDPISSLRDLSKDARDNTSVAPKSIVVDDHFDWQGDVPPDIPLHELIIYEVHLKGFTAHRSSGVKNPGTYLGFIEKIPYLKDLGVNAVEFLPLHEFYVEDFLLSKGLTNYWGYNTIGFFAPESSYSTKRFPGCQVDELKTLVRELHKAGMEIILDVVYNHTAEGNELGPTLCFKGIDNPTYYCLTGTPREPYRYYMNYTGCGNSLNLANPHVIRLVMDSLRYWVEVMHVDGFRFDLASVLGREEGLFHKSASFFDAISQDPVLNHVKLIAEPWDIGTYQVGNFPVDWSEWNGKFRDMIRRFGKGDGGQVRDLGWRLTGSADLYGEDGRSAYNSINFITCHDGFTLNDLVTYHDKHNEANLEDNRDGTNDNSSWNCGIEGKTDDINISNLRKQLIKNYVCYLLFSCGTPMTLGGDEFMRTQRGNNNAYCQDNEISWFQWDEVKKNSDIFNFFKKAIAFEKRCTILQRRKFFFGEDLDADHIPDFTWFGKDLGKPSWEDPELRTLCFQLDGGEERCELGDYHLFFILNADFNLQPTTLPQLAKGKQWYRVIDTSLKSGEDFLDADKEIPIDSPDHYLANPRSTVVLIGK